MRHARVYGGAAAAVSAAGGVNACASASAPAAAASVRRAHLHSHAPARVAAVFGEDAFSTTSSAPKAASSSAAASSSTSPAASASSAARPPPLGSLRPPPASSGGAILSRFTSLFANLPPPTSVSSASGAAAAPVRRLPLAHPPPLEASLPAGQLAEAQAAVAQRAEAVTPADAAASPVAAAVAVEEDASLSVRAAAAATTAQVAITYITPRFLVFVRKPESDASSPGAGAASKSAVAPPTPQSILAQSEQAGLAWVEHGVSARHILLVSESDCALGDFSTMAGFPCSRAFYVTFPRHETRSISRVRVLEQCLHGSGAQAARMESQLGWRLLRYPAQLLLSNIPLSPHPRPNSSALPFGGAAQQKLEARTLIAQARAIGLPGWDLLDESFFEICKPAHKSGLFSSLARVGAPSAGGGVGAIKGSTRGNAAAVSPDYAIRVPPLMKYFQAVTAIVNSAEEIARKTGWIVRTAGGAANDDASTGSAGASHSSDAAFKISADGLPRLPILLQQHVQRGGVVPSPVALSAGSPVPASPSVMPLPSAAPVAATTSQSALSSSPSSKRTAAAPIPADMPRVYFYSMDERGRISLDDESALAAAHEATAQGTDSPAAPAIFQGSKLLPGLHNANMIGWLVKRAARSHSLLLQRFQNQPQILQAPVHIPRGSPLYATALPEGGSLPLASIPMAYPWVSVCAGELNFLRCAVVPIVYTSLQAKWRVRGGGSSSSIASSAIQPTGEHVLIHGGGGQVSFNPANLYVDPSGRLFHPAPPVIQSTAGPAGEGAGPMEGSEAALAADAAPANASASSSPVDSSSSSPAPSSASFPIPNPLNFGLLSSPLTLELELHEAPFSRQEVDYCLKQQEETRRVTILLQEAFQQARRAALARQNTTATRGGVGGTGSQTQAQPPQTQTQLRADTFIAAGVREALEKANLRRALSRFVVMWQGKSYRIGLLEQEVAMPPYRPGAQTTASAEASA